MLEHLLDLTPCKLTQHSVLTVYLMKLVPANKTFAVNTVNGPHGMYAKLPTMKFSSKLKLNYYHRFNQSLGAPTIQALRGTKLVNDILIVIAKKPAQTVGKLKNVKFQLAVSFIII